jgi:hypothetical protein
MNRAFVQERTTTVPKCCHIARLKVRGGHFQIYRKENSILVNEKQLVSSIR